MTDPSDMPVLEPGSFEYLAGRLRGEAFLMTDTANGHRNRIDTRTMELVPMTREQRVMVGTYERVSALMIEVADRLAAVATAPASGHVPGVLRCARCDFRLIKTTLNVRDGNAYANEEPDRCPNCDVPMWRVSWEQEAQEAYRVAESQMNRALQAEAKLSAPAPAAERHDDFAGYLFMRKDRPVEFSKVPLSAEDMAEGWRQDYLYRQPGPTQDAYIAACRALHWRTAQLRAHAIEPDTIAPDAPQYPPEGHVFASAPAGDVPSDGTCSECGAVPRDPVSALCATCTDEVPADIAAPANRSALYASIALLDDFERNGILLGEIENECGFIESVLLCVHELKRLLALQCSPTKVARQV